MSDNVIDNYNKTNKEGLDRINAILVTKSFYGFLKVIFVIAIFETIAFLTILGYGIYLMDQGKLNTNVYMNTTVPISSSTNITTGDITCNPISHQNLTVSIKFDDSMIDELVEMEVQKQLYILNCTNHTS